MQFFVFSFVFVSGLAVGKCSWLNLAKVRACNQEKYKTFSSNGCLYILQSGIGMLFQLVKIVTRDIDILNIFIHFLSMQT